MYERLVDWWYYIDRRKKVGILSVLVFFFLIGGIFALKNIDLSFSGHATNDTISPTISLAVDRTEIAIGETTGISCSATDDIEMETLSLRLGSNILCEGEERCTTSYLGSEEGTFTVTCKATDTANNEASQKQTIIVTKTSSETTTKEDTSTQENTENRAPEWDFAFNDQTIDEDTNITLEITATDPDNDTITYATNDSSFEINSSGHFLYKPEEDFTGIVFVNISARDREFQISSILKITVEQVNDAPNANAGKDFTVQANETFFLNASLSTDLENDTLEYEWDLVEGSELIQYGETKAVLVNATVPEEGNYVVQLTVTDTELKSYDNVTITASGVYSCEESWFCSDPTCYEDNRSLRDCVDINTCGTENDKPETNQSCVYNESESGATGNVIGASQFKLGWEFSLAFIMLISIFTTLLVLVMHNHHGKNN